MAELEAIAKERETVEKLSYAARAESVCMGGGEI
jgi:hypothetical protein